MKTSGNTWDEKQGRQFDQATLEELQEIDNLLYLVHIPSDLNFLLRWTKGEETYTGGVTEIIDTLRRMRAGYYV
jgi:hypothetical protein